MGHLASREFELLGYAWAHRAPVPEPIQREENAFTMEYLGTADQAAPQLRAVHLDDPEPFARAVLEAIESLAGGGIVHPDLSPFNILVHDGRPWIIDLGQALRVDRLGQPRWARLEEARTSLVHAFDALHRYFRKYGIDLDTAPVLRSIFREIDGAGLITSED